MCIKIKEYLRNRWLQFISNLLFFVSFVYDNKYVIRESKNWSIKVRSVCKLLRIIKLVFQNLQKRFITGICILNQCTKIHNI